MKFPVFILLFISGVCFAQRPDFPPPRPDPVPGFRIPRGGSALDDGWQYMQTIADADTSRPDLFNTIPVQIAFTQGGRGFIATLHTVFHTSDGGRTWSNLDRFPPPNGGSDFAVLRSPTFVSGIAPRPHPVSSTNHDTLLVSSYRTDTNVGRIRMLGFSGSYYLQPDTIRFLQSPHWLTGIVIPDLEYAVAFAGWDRKIYLRDSLSYPVIQRWDSLYITNDDQWVSGPVACVGRLLMSVGSHQWVSRDGGVTWSTAPSADFQGDNGVSFADTLHGLTGGGRNDPDGIGWAHFTTNGGLSWSGRTLITGTAIRCVEMVTPEIGFAAGGNYFTPEGEIWKTTDGGQTWNLDATMDAEITAIESQRASGAYVDVIAAGVYPDFRGGVWRNHLYAPDLSGAVLIVEPDTLDFGIVARGDTAMLTATVSNQGGFTAVLYGLQSSDPAFTCIDTLLNLQIAPGGQMVLHLIFAPPDTDDVDNYSALLSLLSADGRTEITVSGSVPLGTRDQTPPLPENASLTVWPNPGNAVFQIRYELARASAATISIYDVSGRTVATLARGARDAGEHVLTWNAGAQASGIYFVTLEAGDMQLVRKLLLLK